MRAIHASGNHPMVPGMRYISMLLRKKLDTCDHLLKNSQQLIAKLRTTLIPLDGKLLKLDVKDFYMSGEHRVLGQTTGDVIAGEEAARARRLTTCILQNQLLRIPSIDDEIFHVKVGSGMGMTFSGDVSDAAFYWMAERDFVLQPATRQRYCIYLYVRYKDDILTILGGTRETRAEFVRVFRSKTDFFKLKVDSFSSSSIEMLDITIFKGPRWSSTGLLDHKLFTKPSSQWQPLSIRSGQAPSVHNAWPNTQLQRVRGLCNNPADAFLAEQNFKDMYLASIGIDIFRAQSSSPSRSLTRSGHPSHLVIPYRREWGSAKIAKTANDICRLWSTRLREHTRIKCDWIRIAWANPGRCLLHQVLGFNKMQHRQSHKYDCITKR